jgi:hypothetical protein
VAVVVDAQAETQVPAETLSLTAWMTVREGKSLLVGIGFRTDLAAKGLRSVILERIWAAETVAWVHGGA